MLFVTQTVQTEDLKEVNNFFNEFEAVKTVDADEVIETPVSQYLTSLVSSHYQKSVEGIENTTIGNFIAQLGVKSEFAFAKANTN